jgi:K+-H+ exchange-related protein
MEVFLVPVASDRYELYCEVPDDDAAPEQEDGAPRGFVQRLRARFREQLAEAERQRRHGAPAENQTGWTSKVKARSLRWIAEAIAEQRLLWHLRRQERACLVHPDDVQDGEAVRVLRANLGRDFDKHRFWLILDSLFFIASGALMLVPGPNVVAYYFGFRMVGHYLSLRGARQGLQCTEWTTEKSAPLTDLRRALSLEPDDRERRVHDIAARLRLEHLATFFHRAAT